MKLNSGLLVAATLLLFSCNGGHVTSPAEALSELPEKDREEIVTAFMATEDACNNGDMEGFMSAYWESDRMIFTGVSGPTYGYKATLERYKKSYPDLETMGMLKFTIIDLDRVDTSTALMNGKFYLSRSIGDLVGHFTLVWRKINGRWVIICDHSSGQVLPT